MASTDVELHQLVHQFLKAEGLSKSAKAFAKEAAKVVSLHAFASRS